MKKLTVISLLFAALWALSCQRQANKVEVRNLRCEGLENPLGIDCAPKLSWEIFSEEKGVMQTAYRILVASSPEKLRAGEGDVWDSGEVQSGESLNIRFGGTVKSRAAYFWKVKTATNKGEAWSEPASWTAGLMQSGWTAQWTGLDKSYPGDVLTGKTRLAARYFRKEFNVEDKPVEKATLYISGLGFYEVSINGGRPGVQSMSPTPTDYAKVVKYNTFDVTGDLTGAANTIGVTLGNGRFFTMRGADPAHPLTTPEVRHFGFPKMILQLEINYTDGTVQTVVSDTSWKATANGPIRANNEFDGEEYDARMEMPGWDEPGFDDSNWETAQAVEPPGGYLEGQINPNITTMETILPVSIKELKPGVYIMDMGQNMVGHVVMQAKGEAGQEVTLRFAETLRPDGSLYMDNLRGALVTDKYILRGGETEEWEPSFTYHGFRYVEITGYPGVPTVNDFAGSVVYDEMDVTGRFETSDETLNQIYQNAFWGIRGNYRGMPTDCPQRDERMGWLGDRAIGSQGESFIFGNHLLYAKWLDDIEQAQRPNGSIPDVAPNYWSIYSDNMTWPGAYVIIANMLYEQYGDLEPIAKHYASMKKWMDYMRANYLKENLLVKDTYGDWCMPPERPELIHSQDPARKTSGTVLSTTFYYRILTLLERFAVLLNKPEDAKAFAAEATTVREAFNAKFFNPETLQYDNNTVTANLLPLCFGMAPKEHEEAVFGHIVEKTMGEFNGHVSTGLVGIQWLMRGLTMYGRPGVAYKIATNRTYPSWGYMVDQGATTIWELWNGNTADPAMNSGNHVMLLGDLIVWYYENLAGIRNHPGSAGFKKIEMKPCPVEGLSWVKASYQSARGRIESSWTKEANRFEWDVLIPANTAATVYIPASDPTGILINGHNTATSEGLRFIKEEGGYAIYETGSGAYHFTSGIDTAWLQQYHFKE